MTRARVPLLRFLITKKARAAVFTGLCKSGEGAGESEGGKCRSTLHGARMQQIKCTVWANHQYPNQIVVNIIVSNRTASSHTMS